MIKIVKAGYYSVRMNRGNEVKTSLDAPFKAFPEDEARLVKKGVAEYVGTVAKAPAPAPVLAEKGDKEENKEFVKGDPKLEKMSYKALQTLASEKGMKSVGAKKADLIKFLQKDEKCDEAAEFDDGTPLPDFDAAGAVF